MVPVLVSTIPLVPPLVEIFANVTPLAPMVVFVMLSAVVVSGVVAPMVLFAPVTLTVPPPVAVNAVFAPVFKLSPPEKLIVAPALLVRLIPVLPALSVMRPLNVTVPPVLFWTLTERAVLLVIAPL